MSKNYKTQNVKARAFKRIIMSLIFMLLIGSLYAQTPSPTRPPTLLGGYVDYDGAGTENNPYLISHIDHLAWMAFNQNTEAYEPDPGWWKDSSTRVYFRQVVDIDASATSTWTNGIGSGLPPIGYITTIHGVPGRHFVGEYDGQGYTISNLHSYYDAEAHPRAGLFSIVSGISASTRSVIKNLGLVNVDIRATSIASGSGETYSYAGGIAGFIILSDIENCFVSGNVTAIVASTSGERGFRVGGLVGNSGRPAVNPHTAIIRNSYSTANVTGTSIGTVGTSINHAGGIIGMTYATTIEDCYSRGNVTASQGPSGTRELNAGGIAGQIGDYSTVRRNYATGQIGGNGNNGIFRRGGIAGRRDPLNNSISITNNVWNNQTMGVTQTMGDGTSNGTNSSLSNTAMQLPSSYTNIGWNFNNIWNIYSSINSEFPHLRLPSNASSSLNTQIATNGISLSWTLPNILGAVSNYRIERQTNDGAWILTHTTNVDQTKARTWTDTNVAINTSYNYRVSANYTVPSGVSTSTNPVPASIPLSTPANFQANFVTGYVELTWSVPNQTPGGTLSYNIDRRVGEGNFTRIASNIAGLSFQDTDIAQPATQFTYRISAMYGNFTSDFSEYTLILPIFTIDPTSHNFGNITVGQTSATQTFTVSNVGGSPLTISTITKTGTHQNDFNVSYPGGAPPWTIPANQSRTFAVSFTPADTGNRTATVQVTDNLGRMTEFSLMSENNDRTRSVVTNNRNTTDIFSFDEQNRAIHDVSLNGTGVIPVFTINPTSHNFGNIEVGQTSATQTFTIINTGNAPLTITSIIKAGTNQSEFNLTIPNPALPWTIAAGGNRMFTVSFSPSSAGNKTANLSITHNASGYPSPVSLSGTGLNPPPVFTINPTSHNFGNIEIGQTSALQTFAISNTGGSPLTITSIITAGTNQSEFNLNVTGLPWNINAGVNHAFTVSFSPSSAGNKTANLSITHNANGSPSTVPLSGTGIQAVFSVNPTSHNFGNIEVGQTSALQTFTIINNGDAPLTVSSIVKAGTNQSEFNLTIPNPPLPWTIAAGGDRTFTVSLTPLYSGTKSASIQITDNLGRSVEIMSNSDERDSMNDDDDIPHDRAIHYVALSGTVISPHISVEPSAYNFGAIPLGQTSALQTFTITNTGNAPLIVSSIIKAGTNQSEFNLNVTGLPWNINAGGNHTFTVSFSPSSAGNKTVNLSISHNADGSPFTVSLYGAGLNPPVFSIDPTSYDFGEINVGLSSNPHTFTIKNTGGSTLTVHSIATSGTHQNEFNFNATGLPWSIVADGNRTFTVTFSPTSAGNKSAFLSITHDANYSPHTAVPLNGNANVSDTDETELPRMTTLNGNFPNPFNPETTIEFFLAESGHVAIDIFNIRGNLIQTLVNTNMSAGRHQALWNGCDNLGQPVGSGIYFYRMTTNEYSSIKRMVLMK